MLVPVLLTDDVAVLDAEALWVVDSVVVADDVADCDAVELALLVRVPDAVDVGVPETVLVCVELADVEADVVAEVTTHSKKSSGSAPLSITWLSAAAKSAQSWKIIKLLPGQLAPWSEKSNPPDTLTISVAAVFRAVAIRSQWPVLPPPSTYVPSTVPHVTSGKPLYAARLGLQPSNTAFSAAACP